MNFPRNALFHTNAKICLIYFGQDCSYTVASIGNWSIAWLEKFKANNAEVKLWEVRKDADFFHCNLCGHNLKYSSQVFQSIYQYWKQLQDISYKRCHSFCGQNLIIPKPLHHIWSHFKKSGKKRSQLRKHYGYLKLHRMTWTSELVMESLRCFEKCFLIQMWQNHLLWVGIICFAGWIRSIAITMACYKI